MAFPAYLLAASAPTDIIGQYIPKIDPFIAMLFVLIFLLLLFFIIAAAIFAFAVKKNWIIIRYPYPVLLFKPSGNSVIPFLDAAALIQTEKGQLKFRLRTARFDIKIPDREYIYPGNWLFGYSGSFREFIPMKLNLIAYKRSPEPQRLKRIQAIADPAARQKAMDDYMMELREMEQQYKPHVDTGIINSLIMEGNAINRELPRKMEWLPYLALGVSAMVIIVVFMLFTASAMKDADSQIQRAVADGKMADAMKEMADVLNQTRQTNERLGTFLNGTIRTTNVPPK